MNEQILELIKEERPVFITGKAGTGKTTLLREIYQQRKDWSAIAIVAPTGVAAKNAGGVTMHSLLRLPLNPYLPNTKIKDLYSIRNKEDVNLIKELDMIIIDEVSMVRCDMMDAMDDILRYYRKNDKPFGGVQIVMFGDLYQLMPVVKDEDWNILKQHYKSPYFFSSDAYKKLNCITVELTHIYRQQDSDFI
jgi:type II secretory pathway predicted ATPase ExeA